MSAAPPRIGILRDDRQGHEHRVGVVLLHRLVQRRAGGRLVEDVPADDLDPVADAAEDQHAVIVADGDARLGHAAGDGHRGQQRLVELVGANLGVQVIARLVEREQAVDLLRTSGDLVEITEVIPRAAVCPDVPGGRDDPVEIDVDRGLRLLPVRPWAPREDARGQRGGPPQLPDADS